MCQNGRSLSQSLPAAVVVQVRQVDRFGGVGQRGRKEGPVTVAEPERYRDGGYHR